jgi:hypothetical protein
MTNKEKELLTIFRGLDEREQKMVIGRVSEFVLHKQNLDFTDFTDNKVKYYPMILVFIT